MAKSINLPLGPNGSNISIPAWASEETLDLIANNLKKSDGVSRRIARSVARLNVGSDIDLGPLLKKFTGDLKTLADVEAENEKKRTKAFVDAAKRFGGHFTDTKAPLTSMAKSIGELGGGASKLVGSMAKDSELFGSVAKELGSGLGKFTDGAGAVAGALLGWNAAKIEQFAEVQQQMIASGAITFDGLHQPFSDLYKRSMESGITYTAFSNVVAQNGKLMASMGKSVGAGSQVFMELIEGEQGILKVADQFGDLGMTSEALTNTYAEYLENRRKAGVIRKGSEINRDALNKGFIKLNMESNAYAALLGKNADETRQQMMSVTENSVLSAGLTYKRENPMFTTEADIIDGLTKDLAVLGADAPQIYQPLMDAIAAAAYESGKAGRKMTISDITTLLGQQNPEILASFEKTGLFGSLEKILSGQVEAGPELMKFMTGDAIADYAAEFMVGSSDMADTAHALDRQRVNLLKQFGNVTDFQELWAKKVKEAYDGMPEAGKSTVAMNNATKVFLAIQERVTADLQDAARVVGKFTEYLNDTMTNGEYDPKRIEGQLTPEVLERLQAGTESMTSEDFEIIENMALSMIKDERRKDNEYLNELGSRVAEQTATFLKPYVGELTAGILGEVWATPSYTVGQFGSAFNWSTGALSDLLRDATDHTERTANDEYIKKVLQQFLEQQENAKAEKKATGGIVKKDRPYIVGDGLDGNMKYAELFMPFTDGKIFTAKETKDIMNADTIESQQRLLVGMVAKMNDLENQFGNQVSSLVTIDSIKGIISQIDNLERLFKMSDKSVDTNVLANIITSKLSDLNIAQPEIDTIKSTISKLIRNGQLSQDNTIDFVSDRVNENNSEIQKLFDNSNSTLSKMQEQINTIKEEFKNVVGANSNGIDLTNMTPSFESDVPTLISEIVNGFIDNKTQGKRQIKHKEYELRTTLTAKQNNISSPEDIEKTLQSQRDMLNLISQLKQVVRFFETTSRRSRDAAIIDSNN